MKAHPSDTMVRIDGLCVASRGAQNVLVKEISLDIGHGECVGLIGESGSGKSTVAKALLGLLPFDHQLEIKGAIGFGDRLLAAKDAKAFGTVRGRKVALISQEPMVAFNPFLSVGYQLDEVSRVHQHDRGPEAKQKSLRLLERVGFGEPERVWAAYPHALSGGMLQRAAIAMALLCEPELLIADESTTSLDATVQKQVVALLTSLVQERHMALLFISHDVALCSQIAGRIVVMVEGQIVECGLTQDLLCAPQHPYTALLVSSARQALTLEAPSLQADALAPAQPPPPPEEGCRFVRRCPRALRVCRHIEPALTGTDGRLTRCFNPVPPPPNPGPPTSRAASGDAP